MDVQFVSDGNGKITAVQIPIEAWQEIAHKIKSIDEQEWHGVTGEEIAAIEAGLKDIQEGRTVPNEEVLRRSRELRKSRA